MLKRPSCVSEVASKFQVTVFLAEGTMMHGLSHKNILSIIAANTDNPKQPLLVYPYVNKGNLKRYRHVNFSYSLYFIPDNASNALFKNPWIFSKPEQKVRVSILFCAIRKWWAIKSFRRNGFRLKNYNGHVPFSQVPSELSATWWRAVHPSNARSCRHGHSNSTGNNVFA